MSCRPSIMCRPFRNGPSLATIVWFASLSERCVKFCEIGGRDRVQRTFTGDPVRLEQVPAVDPERKHLEVRMRRPELTGWHATGCQDLPTGRGSGAVRPGPRMNAGANLADDAAGAQLHRFVHPYPPPFEAAPPSSSEPG
jgi:hypothetical protein